MFITLTSGFALTGLGFNDEVLDKNVVTIGDVGCDVIKASKTEITCTVGKVLPGVHSIVVAVVDKG